MLLHLRFNAAAWVALALLVAVFGACGTASNPASPTATASLVAPGTSLRGVDFTQPPYASDLTRRAGGGDVIPERVRLLDLTGDGIEEAVVVVESGGTLGDIGVGVYRSTSSAPDLAYFRKLAGRVDIRQSSLVIVEGAPGPGDPACCPSQLHETTIEWRNNAFEVTSERTVSNPGAGATSSAR